MRTSAGDVKEKRASPNTKALSPETGRGGGDAASNCGAAVTAVAATASSATTSCEALRQAGRRHTGGVITGGIITAGGVITGGVITAGPIRRSGLLHSWSACPKSSHTGHS